MSQSYARRPVLSVRLAMRLCWCALTLVLAATLSACMGLRTQLPTPTPETVRITPDQLAQAMQQDRFFSDYGRDTLLVEGTVVSVLDQKNHHTVEFRTNMPIRVLCDLEQAPLTARPGDTITVRAPGSGAQRRTEASAVMLTICSMQ